MRIDAVATQPVFGSHVSSTRTYYEMRHKTTDYGAPASTGPALHMLLSRPHRGVESKIANLQRSHRPPAVPSSSSAPKLDKPLQRSRPADVVRMMALAP